ncbi:MAG: NAD(P)-dependent oxidoreductase [Lachnospiraceae bacterium]|nr:NAD(P)-dependent oxidoreductase [Lachnospiraceae bacterium]
MQQLQDKKEQYDDILQKDLEMIIQDEEIMMKLKDSVFLVTGATGMIGSQIVKSLLLYNKKEQANIRIIIVVRSKEKAERIFGSQLQDSMLEVICSDIQEFRLKDRKIDYIIHGASMTGSAEFVSKPVETIKTALFGTMNILDSARTSGIKGMVYLSSLEVYGVTDPKKESIAEENLGYLNPLHVRSSYSEGKRMAECICVSYASEYNVPVKIARLCQTFGAGVEYEDNRVFAQFARSIIEEKDIVLHTQGMTVRNYCYTADAIRAIFYILVKGKSGEAYNVANEQTAISIRDMAETLCQHYKHKSIQVVYQIEDEEKHGYNPVVKIRLNTRKVLELGWKPKVDLVTMYDRMIQSMETRKTQFHK